MTPVQSVLMYIGAVTVLLVAMVLGGIGMFFAIITVDNGVKAFERRHRKTQPPQRSAYMTGPERDARQIEVLEADTDELVIAKLVASVGCTMPKE